MQRLPQLTKAHKYFENFLRQIGRKIGIFKVVDFDTKKYFDESPEGGKMETGICLFLVWKNGIHCTGTGIFPDFPTGNGTNTFENGKGMSLLCQSPTLSSSKN